jgi:predicted metal-binding protein
MIRVTLCSACTADQTALAEGISVGLATLPFAAHLSLNDCMSGCTRPSTLAFRATGKMAYLFGEITLQDLPDILTFLRLYQTSPDGTLTDARPLGALRLKAIARIPA